MNDPAQGMTLTIVDTTGIQAYIFGTNTLRHHMGASWLVDWATQGAVYEVLEELHGRAQTNVDANGKIDELRRIENKIIAAELLYAGGGNAVLVFRERALAIAFTKALTQRVLAQAPGLNVVVTHLPFTWTSDGLANKLDELRQAANQKKGKRSFSMPLLGLGVTADCQFIDLPAEAQRRDGDGARLRVSGQVLAKLNHAGRAAQRLRDEVGAILPDGRDFIYDFDEIGSPGESSFIAVVHIDGNGMGARFEAIAQKHQQPSQNRAYVEEIRELSARIKTIARRALQNTVAALHQAIRHTDPGQGKIGGKVPLRQQGNQQRLPFRPIVYGGDDVTFVCDGRLGLTLAAHYLKQMEQPFASDPQDPDNEKKDKLYVRAGIAVVNNHYPFSRAYQLAEDLAQSAKVYIQAISPTKQVSALDWHFGVNGLVAELDDLRERDYQVSDGTLIMRPILLQEQDDSSHWRTWPFFQLMANNFLEDKDWAERRSKVKAYGEALRAGRAAATQYLKAFLPADIHLAVPPGEPDVRYSGWLGRQAVHYDAVEALDFFVPLQPDADLEATAPAVKSVDKAGMA